MQASQPVVGGQDGMESHADIAQETYWFKLSYIVYIIFSILYHIYYIVYIIYYILYMNHYRLYMIYYIVYYILCNFIIYYVTLLYNKINCVLAAGSEKHLACGKSTEVETRKL